MGDKQLWRVAAGLEAALLSFRGPIICRGFAATRLPTSGGKDGGASSYRYSPASFSTRPMFFLVTKPGPVLTLFDGMTP
jgi:hypothetical protein